MLNASAMVMKSYEAIQVLRNAMGGGLFGRTLLAIQGSFNDNYIAVCCWNTIKTIVAILEN